jgi:hypothetical protein
LRCNQHSPCEISLNSKALLISRSNRGKKDKSADVVDINQLYLTRLQNKFRVPYPLVRFLCSGTMKGTRFVILETYG